MALATSGIATVPTMAPIGASFAFHYRRARTYPSSHAAMVAAFGFAGCGCLPASVATNLPEPLPAE